jgi:UDP-N-acetylglucosamine--N-acetylmuramyl-(pentapeptide) pyrophosphoryl-undecaprenol N-acetylglucosamine transferase
MTASREIRILVTGGGTGGHVSPALAVIQELREQAADAAWRPVFRYVGSRDGLEKTLAQEAGIDFVGVESGKLRRTALLSRANLADGFRVPVGVIQAMREVGRFRPDVLFATGGYVSVPPVIAARVHHCPILIHEQTVQVGLANRIAARCATRIALTFAEAVQDLPRRLRAKTFVTGNPVRPIIFDGDRTRALARFGFCSGDNNLPTVYVTGGAQGAQSLNRTMEAVLPDLLAFCRVIHQCGQPDGERFADAACRLPTELRHRYFVTPFVKDEIGDVFALCDLIAGRSGAGTVAEACALGKPALFIPLVPTGGDEQTRNARRLSEIGAAFLLPGADLDGPRLLSEIRRLTDDRAGLRRMGQAALTLARPEAARALADALVKMAGVSTN